MKLNTRLTSEGNDVVNAKSYTPRLNSLLKFNSSPHVRTCLLLAKQFLFLFGLNVANFFQEVLNPLGSIRGCLP